MKTRSILRAVAVAAVVLATTGTGASPASATVHAYNVEMVSGAITVGGTTFNTPGSGVGTCTSATTIAGTINDASPFTVTSTLSISSPFMVPFFGAWHLSATGTATTNGTYNPGTTTPPTPPTFSGLSFGTSSISFTIRNFNAGSCTVGTTLACSGTASLAAVSGGPYASATLPLSADLNGGTNDEGDGEMLFVNAGGQIDTRGACNFVFSGFIQVGNALTITDNTTDDYPPTGGTNNPDPGAIFEQQ
ncbi:MAG TPA: hypothetical protein VF228_01730 [Iamia sp.]